MMERVVTRPSDILETPEFITSVQNRLDEVKDFISGGGFDRIHKRLEEEFNVTFNEDTKTIELKIDKRKNRDLLWDNVETVIVDVVGEEKASYYTMFVVCNMSDDYIFIKKRHSL